MAAAGQRLGGGERRHHQHADAAVAGAALRTTPAKVSVVAGALGTLATASATFGLHLPTTLIGYELPVLSLLASLLVSLRVSPKGTVTKVVQTLKADAEDFLQKVEQAAAASVLVPAPAPVPAPVAQPASSVVSANMAVQQAAPAPAAPTAPVTMAAPPATP